MGCFVSMDTVGSYMRTRNAEWLVAVWNDFRTYTLRDRGTLRRHGGAHAMPGQAISSGGRASGWGTSREQLRRRPRGPNLGKVSGHPFPDSWTFGSRVHHAAIRSNGRQRPEIPDLTWRPPHSTLAGGELRGRPTEASAKPLPHPLRPGSTPTPAETWSGARPARHRERCAPGAAPLPPRPAGSASLQRAAPSRAWARVRW